MERTVVQITFCSFSFFFLDKKETIPIAIGTRQKDDPAL
jgi:hypothetical protein